ncbi:MAG: FecR domain-containing protein, partial [Pyrinomonadaceae bacterium]
VASKFIISAKAGGVNAVFGEVMVEHPDGRSGRLLKGDEVQIGERVTTGKDGKAEVLMNPGSYVRLGPDSSFAFLSTELDNVQLKMFSGSAIIEVFAGEGFDVELSTDTARFTILQTGVYRIDADKGGSTVAIWKGKLQAGTDKKMTAGGGKQVAFDGNTYSIVKFDRDIKDELALWSRERAKDQSRLSASLRPDRLRDPLINSYQSNRWNLYNSFGLWVRDPLAGAYCFLPFGDGFYSPYGFSFGRSLWWYGMPNWIYRQPAPPNTTGRTTMPVEPNPAIRMKGASDEYPGGTGRGSRGDSSQTSVINAPTASPSIVAPTPTRVRSSEKQP